MCGSKQWNVEMAEVEKLVRDIPPNVVDDDADDDSVVCTMVSSESMCDGSLVGDTYLCTYVSLKE